MEIDRGIRIGVVARPEMAPEELPRVARAVEEAGIDDLWLWEDSFFAGGLVAAATALSATATLRVGLGVMPTPFRNPALAAMEVAALARLHPGRFVAGFGHGVREWMKQVGAAPKSPLGLMEEYVPAVRALLRGEEVSVAGTYVNLERVQLVHPPAADAIPPVLVGANGPKAFALAGRLADGVVLGGVPNPGAAAEAVSAVRAARADSPRAGEPLQAVGYVDLAADPIAQAEELVAAGLTTIVYAPRESEPDPSPMLEAVAAVRASLS
jgi:alkanesulfonate monooxygenase SsuD/methylene tetrahydromethanopterin reductase-like flavin-dependent oxidoreductase (luciferase family)